MLLPGGLHGLDERLESWQDIVNNHWLYEIEAMSSENTQRRSLHQGSSGPGRGPSFFIFFNFLFFLIFLIF